MCPVIIVNTTPDGVVSCHLVGLLKGEHPGPMMLTVVSSYESYLIFGE